MSGENDNQENLSLQDVHNEWERAWQSSITHEDNGTVNTRNNFVRLAQLLPHSPLLLWWDTRVYRKYW